MRRWRVPRAAAAFTHEGPPVRVDSGVAEGDDVGTHYDPMIAKVVARGADRASALAALRAALAGTQVAGLPTNLAFLQRLAGHPAFASASLDELDTGFIERHREELLAAQPVPLDAAALAAVARCKLQAAAAAADARARRGAAAAAGPWAVADAKRLWVPHVQRVAMETGEAAGSGGGGGGGAALALDVAQLSEAEFEVRGGGGAERGAGGTAPLRVSHVTLAPDEGAAGSGAGGGGVVVGGATVRPDGSVAARVTAEVGGRRVAADALLFARGADEDALVLWLGGAAHEFRWPVARWSKAAGAAGAAGAESAAGAVRAPMPGKVVKVLAADGAAVAAGQALVVLESMKMETALAAPRAGVVAGAAGLRAGAQVEEGQVLLRVVEAGGAAGDEGPASASASAERAAAAGA